MNKLLKQLILRNLLFFNLSVANRAPFFYINPVDDRGFFKTMSTIQQDSRDDHYFYVTFQYFTLRNRTYHLGLHIIIGFRTLGEILWPFRRFLQGYHIAKLIIFIKIICGCCRENPQNELHEPNKLFNYPNYKNTQRAQDFFALSLQSLHFLFNYDLESNLKRTYSNQFQLLLFDLLSFINKLIKFVDKKLIISVPVAMFFYRFKHRFILSLVIAILNMQIIYSEDGVESSHCKTGKLVKLKQCIILYSDCQSSDLIFIDRCLKRKQLATAGQNNQAKKQQKNQFEHISNDKCFESCFKQKFAQFKDEKNSILLPGNREHILKLFKQQLIESQHNWQIPIISPLWNYWRSITKKLSLIETIVAYVLVFLAAQTITYCVLFILYKIYRKMLEEQAYRHANQFRRQNEQEQNFRMGLGPS